MTDEQQWRAQIYALLATLLAMPPEQALLDNIKAVEVTDLDSPMGKAWQQLIQAAAVAEPEALKQEYQDLFIGVTEGEVVPYGSYYVSGFLHEKPLAQLRVDLGKLGLERQEDKSEPEDHIAAEFDVLRLILLAQGTPVVDAQTFFNQHIEPWASRFFNDLQQAGSAQFYQAVATLGQEFMRREVQLFK